MLRERNIQSCNVPHTGLVPICSHVDVEDRFCVKVEFLIFVRMAAFYDSCANELNSTVTPSHLTCIKPACQVVKCAQSPIHLATSLLFSSIVAVVEVEVDRQQAPKVDFRQFQEFEVRNEGPRA